MLKSKKRTIIILSIVAVLFLLIICGSALFSLQKVTVEFGTMGAKLQTYNKDAIVQSGKFSYGKNVLFLKFDKNIERIEAEFPYVKVAKVTRNFPNRAVVYIKERVPLFQAKMPDNSIYLLDADLKVLEHLTGEDAQDYPLPEMVGFPLPEDVYVGQFLNGEHYKTIIIGVSTAIGDDDVGLGINTIKTIALKNLGTENEQVDILMTDNVRIEIKGLNNFVEKALGAFDIYNDPINGVQNSTMYPNKNEVIIQVTKDYTLANKIGITTTGKVSG